MEVADVAGIAEQVGGAVPDPRGEAGRLPATARQVCSFGSDAARSQRLVASHPSTFFLVSMWEVTLRKTNRSVAAVRR